MCALCGAWKRDEGMRRSGFAVQPVTGRQDKAAVAHVWHRETRPSTSCVSRPGPVPYLASLPRLNPIGSVCFYSCSLTSVHRQCEVKLRLSTDSKKKNRKGAQVTSGCLTGDCQRCSLPPAVTIVRRVGGLGRCRLGLHYSGESP